MSEDISATRQEKINQYKATEAQMRQRIQELMPKVEELQFELAECEFNYVIIRKLIVSLGGEVDEEIKLPNYMNSINDVYGNMVFNKPKWSANAPWSEKITTALRTIGEGYVDDIANYIKSVEPKMLMTKLKQAVTFHCYLLNKSGTITHTKHGKKYKYRLK